MPSKYRPNTQPKPTLAVCLLERKIVDKKKPRQRKKTKTPYSATKILLISSIKADRSSSGSLNKANEARLLP